MGPSQLSAGLTQRLDPNLGETFKVEGHTILVFPKTLAHRLRVLGTLEKLRHRSKEDIAKFSHGVHYQSHECSDWHSTSPIGTAQTRSVSVPIGSQLIGIHGNENNNVSL